MAGLSGNVEIVHIGSYSDGDRTHRPKPEWRLVNPPHIYLEKLGGQWMDRRGQSRPNIRYYLDRLPDGYALFERERPQNPKLVDRHLYGHPKHKFFDSPNRFFPHFYHLMTNNSNEGCPCTICGTRGTVPLPMRGAAPKPTPKIASQVAPKPKRFRHVDEEYTPDVIRQLLDTLEMQRTLDQPIEEKMSMDWRAERNLIPEMLDSFGRQESWIPRPGEIVLFVREIDGEIAFDNVAKEYKVFKESCRGFTHHPRWEAGVIGQTPDEVITMQDLLLEKGKSLGVNYSGFRVEPLPDPNSTNKSFTKRYTYVPLHHIRPFVFCQEFLTGVGERSWHPTIKHALKATTSMSLIEKYRFKGTWPTATVFCKGIYIGAELICVGDTVRLLPSNGRGGTVLDVLHIESVRLNFTNLDKASSDDMDEGHPYNSAVYLVGKAYTISRSRAWSNTPLSEMDQLRTLPNGVSGYGPFYPLHDPSKSYSTTFTRALGRSFDKEPMRLWFPAVPSSSSDDENNEGDDSDDSSELTTTLLSKGLSGLLAARLFGSQNDTRILPSKTWFWADSRVEALGVESVNGVEVASRDEIRHDELLDEWRKGIRVLERVADPDEVATLKKRPVGRPPKKLQGAMAMAVGKGEETETETDVDVDKEDYGSEDEKREQPRSLMAVVVDKRPVGRPRKALGSMVVRKEETETEPNTETESEGSSDEKGPPKKKLRNVSAETDEDDAEMRDASIESEDDESQDEADEDNNAEDDITITGSRVMREGAKITSTKSSDVDDDDDDDGDADELLGNFMSRQKRSASAHGR